MEKAHSPERYRRELMIRVALDFKQGVLNDTIDRLPYLVMPSDTVPNHCCVAHDREVLRCRLLALLGFEISDKEGEGRILRDYLSTVTLQAERPEYPLVVAKAACQGCPDSKIEIIPDRCRNCFAQTCVHACPNNAINILRNKAVINQERCLQCGKCLVDVCLYNAIKRIPVPCENACPVDAIRKTPEGHAEINFKKCIFCGKCFRACPRGAVMQRSEFIPVLKALHEGVETVALIAPSAGSQFPGGKPKLCKLLRAAGFSDVVELSDFENEVAEMKVKEFATQRKAGRRLLADAGCASFVEFVNRCLPPMRPYLSHVPDAMVLAARYARDKYPNAVIVFIGPCIAKRYESRMYKEIDRVITFEELGAILIGSGNVSMEPQDYAQTDAEMCESDFPQTGGVNAALIAAALEMDSELEIREKFVNGINAQTAKLLRLFLMGQSRTNYVEVIGCTGGCVNGPCSLAPKD